MEVASDVTAIASEHASFCIQLLKLHHAPHLSYVDLVFVDEQARVPTLIKIALLSPPVPVERCWRMTPGLTRSFHQSCGRTRHFS